MLPYFWYMLKVIVCSGILFGYYWLFLRNKIFHQYNRFYLLAAMSLSLLLPLLKINFWQQDSQQNQAIQILQAVSVGDEYMNNMVITPTETNWSLLQLYPLVYWLVSIIFFLFMLRTLFLIRTLLKKYPVQLIENISFVNTNDNSTPFSFFKYIFWNSSIDMGTTTGRQIFKHEVVHIQEKHTHDKLFINIVLIFCWCNPFFWLYRKELNMIHEFIADKKAVEDSDTAAFAAMILQAAYPRHRFELTNNFFYSPIKRRLLMLTKNNNPRANYFGRVMVLPLAILVFAAFTFKAKNNSTLYDGKKITVVIDAGHGGKDLGARSSDGIFEKDLTLAIAKKIKELNSNDAIEIILTRDEDLYLAPNQKEDLTKDSKADLLISFHVDASPAPNLKSGVNIYVARDEFPNAAQSKLLASALINEFSKNYSLPVSTSPKQRETGTIILQTNNIPSVLIEAGFMSNENDIAYLKTAEAKENIAKNVLAAIEKFAKSLALGKITPNKISNTDTIPAGMFVNVKHTDADYLKSEEFKNKALVIVDSKEIGNVGNNYLERSAEKYSTIVVYNPKEAQKEFGIKGKYGVIKLTQKDAMFIIADAISYNEKTKSVKLSGNNTSIKGDFSNSLIYLEDKIISPEVLNQIAPDKISSISILKGDKIYDIIDAKGKTSVINISLKADDLPEILIKSKLLQSEKPNNKSALNDHLKNVPENVLYIINGKETDKTVADNIKPEAIEDIRVIKADVALKVYGEKGRNGVVIVNLKPEKLPPFIKKLTSIGNMANQGENPYVEVDGKEYNGHSLVKYMKETGIEYFDNVQVFDKIEGPKRYGQKASDGAIIVITKDENNKPDSSIFRLQEKQTPLVEQQAKVKTDYAEREKLVMGRKMQDQEMQSIKQKMLVEKQALAKPDYAGREKPVMGRKLNDQEMQNIKQKMLIEQRALADLNYAGKEKLVMARKLNDQEIQNIKQKTLIEKQALSKQDYNESLARIKDKYLASEKEIAARKELLIQQDNIVFIQTEQSPQFTGGEEAWKKYLGENLKPNTPVDEGWKAGKFTVMVKFIVHADGTISDVTTENYKGSKTARHCIDIIMKTPKWQPAIQNGRKVNAYKKQPITFVIEE